MYTHMASEGSLKSQQLICQMWLELRRVGGVKPPPPPPQELADALSYVSEAIMGGQISQLESIILTQPVTVLQCNYNYR